VVVRSFPAQNGQDLGRSAHALRFSAKDLDLRFLIDFTIEFILEGTGGGGPPPLPLVPPVDLRFLRRFTIVLLVLGGETPRGEGRGDRPSPLSPGRTSCSLTLLLLWLMRCCFAARCTALFKSLGGAGIVGCALAVDAACDATSPVTHAPSPVGEGGPSHWGGSAPQAGRLHSAGGVSRQPRP